jgi:ABC-type glutathione transport system ATPase component
LPTSRLATSIPAPALRSWGFFQQLNERGMTVIMVTHELDIARYCRRVVVMRDGLIRSDEASKTVSWPPRNWPNSTLNKRRSTDSVMRKAELQTENAEKDRPPRTKDFSRSVIRVSGRHLRPGFSAIPLRRLIPSLFKLLIPPTMFAVFSKSHFARCAETFFAPSSPCSASSLAFRLSSWVSVWVSGAKAEVDKRIASMGQNLLTVLSGNMSRGGVRGGFGMAPNLTAADYEAIRGEISSITAVSPEARTQAQIAAGNQNSFRASVRRQR